MFNKLIDTVEKIGVWNWIKFLTTLAAVGVFCKITGKYVGLDEVSALKQAFVAVPYLMLGIAVHRYILCNIER